MSRAMKRFRTAPSTGVHLKSTSPPGIGEASVIVFGAWSPEKVAEEASTTLDDEADAYRTTVAQFRLLAESL
jgi:hypothetical protein